MHFNATTDYAVFIMLYLSKHKRTISTSELSEHLSISKRYVSSVAAKLRDGHLITVSKGQSGGYRFIKEPSMVSVYDIVTIMEGKIDLLKHINVQIRKCLPLSRAYAELESHIRNYLKAMTLNVLAKESADEWHQQMTERVRMYASTLSFKI